MYAFKRIIFAVLMFSLAVCNCCEVLQYSAVCEEEQITIMVSFEKSFVGTIFANGYNGDPNCSLPNMETSGSNIASLSLPYMNCNTTIRRLEGQDNLQAMNIITIQFHPLIKSVLDCEIEVTCDIDYPLPYDFISSYLNRDLNLPTLIKTKLDIMSSEKLFGDKVANMLGVSRQYFLIINVTDGDEHDRLRIRKCYAHAERVIDQVTNPDLLLEDNKCDGDGLINRLSLKADESYSDLRDFSALQNMDISFTKKPFYITCAFDLCLQTCAYSCFGDMEVKNSPWSTVRTYQIDVLDESFTGFRNKNIDLRASIKILSDRFKKLKDFQIASKNAVISKPRTPRLDSLGDMTNMTISKVLQEDSLSKHKSSKLLEHDEEISTTNMPETSENMSDASKNHEVIDNSEKLIDSVNSSSLGNVSEQFQRRSIFKEETEDTDNDDDTTIVDSLEITSVTDISDESKIYISAADCSNSTCRSNEKTKSIPVLESLAANSIPPKNNSSEFDETLASTSDNILTVLSNLELTTHHSIEQDCVPYLKFTSVTASLSVLSVSLFLICLGVILFYRKERKRYTSQSKYLYSDF